MAYNEKLADKIRQTLAHIPSVEEKRMFGGIAFMVNGKMCLTVGANRMMFRIDPGIHEEVIQKPGCIATIMKGREMKGYVHVNEENLQKESDFNYWVTLALDFNKNTKQAG